MPLSQFNCRLSDQTIGQINELATALECSQADVIRSAIRKLYRVEIDRNSIPANGIRPEKKSGKNRN